MKSLGAPACYWWDSKVVQPRWRTVWQSLKKMKPSITIWSRNFASGYIPKRTEREDLNWYLYTNVHSSIIRNSQKVETAQMSVDTWVDKQNVCTWTVEYYLALKRKGTLTRGGMDKPWGHYGKGNKPGAEKRNIVWFCLCEFPGVVRPMETEGRNGGFRSCIFYHTQTDTQKSVKASLRPLVGWGPCFSETRQVRNCPPVVLWKRGIARAHLSGLASPCGHQVPGLPVWGPPLQGSYCPSWVGSLETEAVSTWNVCSWLLSVTVIVFYFKPCLCFW